MFDSSDSDEDNKRLKNTRFRPIFSSESDDDTTTVVKETPKFEDMIKAIGAKKPDSQQTSQKVEKTKPNYISFLDSDESDNEDFDKYFANIRRMTLESSNRGEQQASDPQSRPESSKSLSNEPVDTKSAEIAPNVPTRSAISYLASDVIIGSVMNKTPEKPLASSLNKNASMPNFESSKSVMDKSPAYSSQPSSKETSLVKENISLKTAYSSQAAEIKYLLDKQDEKPTCREAINRYLIGKHYCFDLFKSKKDKINLLKEAINSSDGNAILSVVLYLKSSLLPEIFYDLLQSNVTALKQYTFYLEQTNNLRDLVDFYKYQKNLNEAYSVEYFKSILCDKYQDLSEKSQLYSHYENEMNDQQLVYQTSQIPSHVKKHISLLRVQKDILKNKSSFLRKDEGHQNAMDVLLGNTTMYTFSFLIKYEKELNNKDSYNIEILRKQFEITQKELCIWYVKALAEIKMWTLLENYVTTKKVFNMIQKPLLPYEVVFYILLGLKAPNDQLLKYLALIDNTDYLQHIRDYASSNKLSELFIESCKILKDRIALLNYRARFKENSAEYIKISILVKENKIKWKN